MSYKKYKQVEGDWYFRDGKFFHMHQSTHADGHWRAYYPIKDIGLMAYCMQCKKEVSDNIQMLHDLQKLGGNCG